MYQAVIFDLDGTLLNTLPSLVHSGNTVLKKLGYPTHEQDDYRQMVGSGISNLVWEMLPKDFRDHQHSTALKQYRETYKSNLYFDLAPYPGIPELVEILKENKIKLAVLSNKSQSYSRELVTSFFPGKFDLVIGAGADYPLKPDPASAQAIADFFGLDNSKILFVGDSNVDMMTAKNANMSACAVTWGFRSRDELVKAGSDYVVETAEEISQLVFNDILK
ncbi:MAG: HAD family hydrolase [Fastidiosipila sp.]|nr:HAD family hydrolase [Fastidiosipila sp.]